MSSLAAREHPEKPGVSLMTLRPRGYDGAPMRIKLGDLLVRANVISDAQLTAALTEQRKSGSRLGETLVMMGTLTEDLLVKALSKQLGIPRADLTAPVTGAALRKMDRPLAMAHEAVPLSLSEDGRTLTVAMSDPLDLESIDKLRGTTGCRVVAYLAGPVSIKASINRIYPLDGTSPTTQAVDSRALQRQIAQQMKAPPAPAIAPRITGPIPTRAAPPGAAPRSASELLRSMEEVQHREITALRAMVELLIDKGVFSRDEYLSRVKR